LVRYTEGVKSADETNLRDTLINPYYAIVFADSVFKEQKPAIAKEDWVLTNTKLLEEDTPGWLEQLLLSLSEKSSNRTFRITNPQNVILISQRLSGEHEPLVTASAWKDANIKLLKELGMEEWLWRLLGVLETGGPDKL
jgi:hypothetical protein